MTGRSGGDIMVWERMAASQSLSMKFTDNVTADRSSC